jgi:hypothetical protein
VQLVEAVLAVIEMDAHLYLLLRLLGC